VAVLDEIDSIGVDGIYCLGDLVGYNANPNECVELVRARNIPSIMGNHDAAIADSKYSRFFNPAAKAAIDWTRDNLSDDNKAFLKGLKRGAQIFNEKIVSLLVHANPDPNDGLSAYIEDWVDAMNYMPHLVAGTNVCFFGHSHKAGAIINNVQQDYISGIPSNGEDSKVLTLEPHLVYFINSGAVGQPRDRDPRAPFGILDTTALTFTWHRVDYDLELTGRKVTIVGLPPYLAERLKHGK